MKTILDYTKYLIAKPTKILWLLVLNILVQIIGICVFSGDVYAENGTFVMVLLSIFITVVFLLGNMQPFKEWKDGLPKSVK